MSIQLKNNIKIIHICVDIENFIIIKRRRFIVEQLSNIAMQKLTFLISVRKIENKIVKFNEYIKVKILFNNVLNNKNIDNAQSIIEIINMKIYFIDDFVVNLLLNNNVIFSQNMKINSKKRCFIISKCENIRVLLEMLNCFTLYIKRIICFCQIYILMFNELIKMLIIYYNALLNDRNFLFKSHC